MLYFLHMFLDMPWQYSIPSPAISRLYLGEHTIETLSCLVQYWRRVISPLKLGKLTTSSFKLCSRYWLFCFLMFLKTFAVCSHQFLWTFSGSKKPLSQMICIRHFGFLSQLFLWWSYWEFFIWRFFYFFQLTSNLFQSGLLFYLVNKEWVWIIFGCIVMCFNIVSWLSLWSIGK